MSVAQQGLLMTPGEVMSLFEISAQRLRSLAGNGLLSYVRTPGGHRRYIWAEVREKETEVRRYLTYLDRVKAGQQQQARDKNGYFIRNPQ